jgi:hypothetical protein
MSKLFIDAQMEVAFGRMDKNSHRIIFFSPGLILFLCCHQNSHRHSVSGVTYFFSFHFLKAK